MSRIPRISLTVGLLLLATAFVLMMHGLKIDLPNEDVSDQRKGRSSGHAMRTTGTNATNPKPKRTHQRDTMPLSGDMAILDTTKQARRSKLIPKFNLIDESGRLSDLAIEALNLGDEQAVEIQRCVRDFMEASRSVECSIIQNDALRSDPKNGISAFKILPNSDAFRPLFAKFYSDVAKAVGNPTARQAMELFPVDSIYGGLGEDSVSIQVVKDVKQVMGGGLRFELEGRDGETGQLKSRATLGKRQFERHFPGVADFLETQ
jgi:hypothetical protein